jgi:hypothetical protein
MASFSSYAALLVLVAYSVLMLSGCFTGNLIESGRHRYTVIGYSRVAMEGDILRIDYSLAREGISESYVHAHPDAHAHSEAHALAQAQKATAELPFTSLFGSPTPPVDEVALDVQTSSRRNGSDFPLVLNHRTLPMLSESANEHGQSEADVRKLFMHGELEAWIESVPSKSGVGRPIGFRLCSSNGKLCYAQFSSGALARDRIALWIYLFAPLTIAIDLTLLPVQIATLPILLAVSD